MQMTKKQLITVSIELFVVIGIAAGAWYHSEKAPASAPAATSTPEAASTTISSVPVGGQAVVTAIGPFPINAADTIASWNFTGAYAGNSTLIAQAKADSAKQASQLGKVPDTYDLYISIGNDANLLGEGKSAYDAYNHAIAIYPNQGLAYANLAHLMDELGAYHTAADAYAKAVAVEPGILEYQIDRLTFLTRQFPKDNALILAAFADASKQFGVSASILSIKAEWLESLGSYADAVKVWQMVKTLSPASRVAAIDAQIARDEAKE